MSGSLHFDYVKPASPGGPGRWRVIVREPEQLIGELQWLARAQRWVFVSRVTRFRLDADLLSEIAKTLNRLAPPKRSR